MCVDPNTAHMHATSVTVLARVIAFPLVWYFAKPLFSEKLPPLPCRCLIEDRIEQNTERAKGLSAPLRSKAKEHNMSVAVSHIDGRSVVVQVIFTEQVS